MKKIILAFILFAWPAQAQLLTPMASTPDLTVSSASTARYAVSPTGRGMARWFSIKNDCATALYFDLTDTTARGGADYPLRLEPGESFTMAGRLYAINASNDHASSNCTFTLQIAK